MAGQPQKTLFGHPLGLYVLFFTELWERFSFYGMRALLVLYMVNHFMWSQEDASSLLGTYAALAYGTPVIGGFIADRFLGAKRAVVVGGVLLVIGHTLMAFEPLPIFYTALGFIIAGVGFLKPNISTQVGKLYPPGDGRRDGGFTIFYMGINLGALFGPLLCDWLRIHYGWHYGFGAAGVGMVFGLIVYVIGQRKLVEFNQDVGELEKSNPVAAPAEAHAAPKIVRDRVIVLLVVFAFVILFWMAFEQSANVMIVWADKHTNLMPFSAEPTPPLLDATEPPSSTASGLENFSIGAGQTQSFNPFFIITLAPLVAWLWLWLDRRRLQPSTPAKMSLGILLVSLAFLVFWPATRREGRASSAPLAALPEGIDLGQYGATRLHYDAENAELQMQGVLPDTDRLKLLASAVAPDLRAQFEGITSNSVKQVAQAAPLEVQVTDAPPHFKVIGVEAQKVATWDADSKTLSVTGPIKARAKVELLAMAAPAEFKAAVDKVYVDSSQFRISIWWLVLHFLLITLGELCLSPVGLSLVTKLAPPRHVGLLMGGWFLATAIAEKLAHVFGGMWGSMPPLSYFVIFVWFCAIGGFFLLLLVPLLRRKMHGVH